VPPLPDSTLDNLQQALGRHQIEFPPDRLELLDRYRAELWSWNERLNLTRHTDCERFVTRDVVDSLALERFLEPGERVLDIGTGGGVPGIILAIARPDLEVTLSESVAKKARAVAAIVESLELPVTALHARAEEILTRPDGQFDTLVARAVAPLEKLLTWLEPHWDAVGQLLAIKGRKWVEERAAARERGLLRGLELRRLQEYTTPGSDAVSVILRVRPDPDR